MLAAGLALALGREAPAEPFRAGASSVPIAVVAGMPLAGWDRKDAVAEAERDRVDARALVLEGAGGHPRVALVVLDVFVLWPDLHSAVSDASEDLDLDALLVVASHTHSGPGGYAAGSAARALGLGRPSPDARAAIVGAAQLALREATGALEPARAGSGLASAPGISRHAERAQGPVDERVPIVRIDADEGARIATLFAFGAAPAVLSRANRAFSGDYPRHARQRLEAVHGGVALFLPGATADQVPLHGGLEQRRGDVDFEAAAAAQIGNALGLVVAAGVASLPLARDPQLALRQAVFSPPPPEPFRGCTVAPLADLGRRLGRDEQWRRTLFGRDPGGGASLTGLRLGGLRLLFSPFDVSAALAFRLRDEAGADAYAVSHAGGWLGAARVPEEPPASGWAACRQLFGAELARKWLRAASEALPPAVPGRSLGPSPPEALPDARALRSVVRAQRRSASPSASRWRRRPRAGSQGSEPGGGS